MKTLRRYLRREIVRATGFVLFALLALFSFFDLLAQMDDLRPGGYTLPQALAYVALSLPSRTYELMPIAALIGAIFALSQLAANSEFTIMRVSGMSTRALAVAVMRVGLAFVALTYAFGELVAPLSERKAQEVRAETRGQGVVSSKLRSGVWVRDTVRDAAGEVQRWRFVNVGVVRPDGSSSQWRIFEFDRDFRLLSIGTAATGRLAADDGSPTWLLTDVVETRLPVVPAGDTTPAVLRTEIVRMNERQWESALTPNILGVLLVQPERMAAVELIRYIGHLSANRQQTEPYEIALWNKIFYPLAIVVMMMLALPFAYLHVRQGSVSLKIFAGVMIGVLFYMLNKLFAHLGLLHTWPPIVVAALPSLVVLAVALGALYWIERR
ncbi:MAG: LPS export ABC transporter permease LptG [Burkholderiales bacterium]|jgi:lipopolysaccharide export system permease protein|nr:LPS export ABC transporter permease LptG [Burkholderiales bacterium]